MLRNRSSSLIRNGWIFATKNGKPLFRRRSLSIGGRWSSSLVPQSVSYRPVAVQHFLVNTTSIHFSAALRDEVIEIEGPAFAESITEGDIRWLKQVGDFVKEDELVAEVETDKTSVEVPSPHSGVIVELLVPDGEKVEAKQKIYKLRLTDTPPEGAAPAETPKAEEPKATEAAPPPPAPKPAVDTAGPIPTSLPPVPELPKAPMSSVDPSQLKVTPLPMAKAPTAPVADPKAMTGARTETRVKMNRMRLRIAQRLKEAQNTYAMLTTFNTIDMSNVTEMRNAYKDAFVKKHGIKIGFMSPFIKATAYALMEQPVVNAVIDESEILYRQYCDISVAVATPKGLVVPVLRNAENMNFADIERELNRLGMLARDGKLAIEDMDGGTFTISNGGVFGSRFGTPIINPPQSAILGMHAIIDTPVAINGKVEIRPIMTVALTYDHRLVDGREAVTFLKKIKDAVEDPRIMLMDL